MHNLRRFVSKLKLEGILRARLLLFSRRISKLVIRENCSGISPFTLVPDIESSAILDKDIPKVAGSLPLRLGIPFIDSRTKLVSSLRLVGISPTKRFGPNESEVSKDAPEILLGMVPVNSLSPIARSLKGKSKRDSGNVPESAFDSTLKTVRLSALPIVVGIGPFNLFDPRSISINLFLLEIEGILPDKALPLKFTERKVSLAKYDFGIEPIKLLLATEYPSMVLSKAGASES